ncbi:MAG TPA: hypothetical protein VIH53_14160 [Gemmatimonadaceae bacterium]
MNRSFRLAALVVLALSVTASHKARTHVNYELAVDARDSTSVRVRMQIGPSPRSVRVGMAVHPEYDDRFWRFISDWEISGVDKTALLQVDRENVWRVISHAGHAYLNYRIQLPGESSSYRPVWHTAIRADGGSINPVDTFLYLPDVPQSEVKVSLSLPGKVFWDVPATPRTDFGTFSVTRLGGPTQPRANSGTIAETDFRTLLDSPILYGNSLREWEFSIDGIPHTVVYWPLPNATAFDTARFVAAIEKVAREAVAVFGKPPYPHYNFLIEDGAWGALEHRNSVTLGMPSRDLAGDPLMYLPELAHEFFHAWNLMRLYPEGRGGGPSVEKPAHATGLWLSEGVTIYYADALTRRAGFPEDNKSRTDLLAEELESYYANPGNTRMSPEVASARAVDTTGINGDYDPDYYSQGRLIGTALDLIIKDSTHDERNLDDLMRALYSRFADKRGFTTTDVQNAANDVCGCTLDRFFDDHVRHSRPIDFTRYLSSIGLRAIVDTIPATDSAGTSLPDTRVWAYPPRSGGKMRVWIQDPSSVWGRAGLHTGMELLAFNNAPIDSFPRFRRALRTVKLGQVVPVDIIRDGAPARINVSVTGYARPRVRIVDDPTASPAQIRKRGIWLSGR